MTEFKVPELGENVEAGDVTRILVNVGDTIQREQPVLELETDKATIEVPSSVEGVVKEIRIKQGDKVSVGTVVLTVDDGPGGGKAAPAPSGATEEEPSKPEPPAPAREARQEQKVVSMQRPSRPVADPPPPAKPARTDEGQESRGETKPAKGEASGEAVAAASPAVRRLAREIGVDVNEISGSGPDGRISQEDVKEHARRILSSVGVSTAAAGPPRREGSALPDFSKWGEVERKAMNNIRRKTAEHLSRAWVTIPHVTQCDKADITAMEELRAKFRAKVQQAGGNLTVTAILVKVLAVAVKQFPQFNASVDVEANEIIYKKYVNVGVAVDTEWGLLVPVIRGADRKNITEIAIELHQLSEKARSKKLTLEEMSGGGMSISNLGGIGGTYFTPIVNWPEVAILGVSRGIIESVWREGAFQPRQLLPLSLSYDHRVIDGADAVRFLRWVVDAVEQPFLLPLLE